MFFHCILSLLTVSYIVYPFKPLSVQNDAVQWRFGRVPHNDGTLVFQTTATIKNGWHLYSQHLADGGPIPTKINFTPHPSYSLSGATCEYGDKVQYHDELYDMEITWYSGIVTFEQPIVPHSYPVFIRGTIEYMTCDEHTCVPSKKEFAVTVEQP